MKSAEVKKINQDWKYIYLKGLESKRDEMLNKLSDIKEEYLDSDKESKIAFIQDYIFELSLLNDDEVNLVLKSIGVGKTVTNYFVSASETFKALDQLYEDSVYLFPYEFIWEYYKALSNLFFFKQLTVQFNLDLTKELNNFRGKEKRGTIERSHKLSIEQLKEIDKKVEEEELSLRILIKDGEVSSTIRKTINKPHKIVLYNLYKTIMDCNLAAPIDENNITDFYCHFYDLMKILLKDKSILNDNPNTDVRANYATVERFKTKRVKSLLKLKGYGNYG